MRDGGLSLIVRYRRENTGEAGTFTGRREFGGVTVDLNLRRSLATRPTVMSVMAKPCGKAAKGDEDVQAIVRTGETDATILRVQVSPDLTPESVHLVNVPGHVLDGWFAR